MADLEERVVISRVLVTFDTFPLGQAALEAAAGLASGLGAELAGLFVEDINLMRMAELPFARELGLSSAAVRRVEAIELERTLRLQAERVRTALAAASLALPASGWGSGDTRSTRNSIAVFIASATHTHTIANTISAHSAGEMRNIAPAATTRTVATA